MKEKGYKMKEKDKIAARVRESLPHSGGKVRMGGKRVSRIKAKELRNNPTDAELKLWRYLRHRRIGGQKFRRQHPVGPYVVDFACLEKGLIVEVDGGQHGERAAYDSERTAWLESQGFRVLRFWNNELLRDVEVVLDLIVGALEKCGEYYPHLNPPPGRGRRNRGRILSPGKVKRKRGEILPNLTLNEAVLSYRSFVTELVGIERPNALVHRIRSLQKEGIKRERIDFSPAARNDDRRERRDCRASFHSARNDGIRVGCGAPFPKKRSGWADRS